MYLQGIKGRIRGYLHRVPVRVGRERLDCKIAFSRELGVSFNILGRDNFFLPFLITFNQRARRVVLESAKRGKLNKRKPLHVKMAKSKNPSSPFRLLPDEEIIFRANPHLVLLLFPVFGLVLFWLAYLFLFCARIGDQDLERLCYLVSGFAFPLVILMVYLDWHFNRLYLTNRRVVKERGIIGKRFMSVFLEQVEDITCSYGIIGWLFGFGDLEIETAGTYGKLFFRGIPAPKKKKYRIEKEVKNLGA